MATKGQNVYRPVLYFSKNCSPSTKLRRILKTVPELAKRMGAFDVEAQPIDPSTGVTHTPAIVDERMRSQPFQSLEAFKWVYAQTQLLYKNSRIDEATWDKFNEKYNTIVNDKPSKNPTEKPSQKSSAQSSPANADSPLRGLIVNNYGEDELASYSPGSKSIKDLLDQGKIEGGSTKGDHHLMKQIHDTLARMPEPQQRVPITRESQTPKKPITEDDLKRIVEEEAALYARNQ
jgi:hypothetical protein